MESWAGYTGFVMIAIYIVTFLSFALSTSSDLPVGTQPNGIFGTIILAPLNTDGVDLPDYLDLDSDNDDVNDNQDAFPRDPDEHEDTDQDCIGNNQDDDDDGDTIPDAIEGFESIDTDLDGIPDSLDTDTDNDGILDINEAGAPGSTSRNFIPLDADGDGIPDFRDSLNPEAAEPQTLRVSKSSSALKHFYFLGLGALLLFRRKIGTR